MSSPPLTPSTREPTSYEEFRFQETGTPCEWAESYRPGGLHPVHFGDVFNDRYEVIRKLGDGSFSTVWLAKDYLLSRYVALKIEVARQRETRELQVQQHLAKRTAHDPLSTQVVTILDYFRHKGPNGIHQCLVQEPMGPSVANVLDAPDEEYDPINPLFHGLQFLHKNGVVHGDLQAGNILFALHDLSAVGLDQLKQNEATSRIDHLHRIDGKADKWAPKYLVVSQPLSEHTVPDPDSAAKLCDLGQAFFVDDPPTKVVAPLSLQAPEVILGEPLGTGVDIWSFGCLLFSFITGISLFQLPPFGFSDEALKDKHLIQMSEIIQPLPENLVAKWPSASKYFGPEGERLNVRPGGFDKRFLIAKRDKQDGTEQGTHGTEEDGGSRFRTGEQPPVQPCDSLEKLIRDNKPSDVDEAEEEIIVSLLRSIFQYDPAKRPSAADLLEHAWFKN